MIELSAADDFLKELEEKNKISEKSGIEEVIKKVEQALDKLRENFGTLKDKSRSAGIKGSDLDGIKREIRDKVSGQDILGI